MKAHKQPRPQNWRVANIYATSQSGKFIKDWLIAHEVQKLSFHYNVISTGSSYITLIIFSNVMFGQAAKSSYRSLHASIYCVAL